MAQPLALAEAMTEVEALAHLKTIAAKNKVLKSFIGMGYYDCVTPGVIQRNILENPGWYTRCVHSYVAAACGSAVQGVKALPGAG